MRLLSSATKTKLLLAVFLLFSLLPQGTNARRRKKVASRHTIEVNDKLDVIVLDEKSPDYRKAYEMAGKLMGRWTINFAGVGIDGHDLLRLAKKNPDEPFVRTLREGIGRPIDKHDFLLLIDDLLVAAKKGLWGKPVYILPGRARKVGALLHPQDVFRRDRPRDYPYFVDQLHIDPPRRRPKMPAAHDGDPLGPNWIMRYRNPIGREAKLRALAKLNPSGTFANRIRSLLNQLEEQGAQVGLYTTVRDRRRGYLMWGAYSLSKRKSKRSVKAFVKRLNRLNHEWGLNIPIQWMHPRGWEATVEAARKMADAFDVVYATKTGAMRSNHYDGKAVDFTAVALPRKLTLTAPDGMQKTFDLSDPDQSRDFNLTPEIIAWVERHFQMKKLQLDYPHWNDTAKPESSLMELAASMADMPLPPPPGPPELHVNNGACPPEPSSWFDSTYPFVASGLLVSGLFLLFLGIRKKKPAS